MGENSNNKILEQIKKIFDETTDIKLFSCKLLNIINFIIKYEPSHLLDEKIKFAFDICGNILEIENVNKIEISENGFIYFIIRNDNIYKSIMCRPTEDFLNKIVNVAFRKNGYVKKHYIGGYISIIDDKLSFNKTGLIENE